MAVKSIPTLAEEPTFEEQQRITFSRQMQAAMLGYVMADPIFRAKCKQYFVADYFADTILGDIYNSTIAFADKYGSVPSEDALIDFMAKVYHKDYGSHIKDCISYKTKYPFSQITNTIADWAKCGLFRKHFKKALSCYHKEDTSQFTQITREFLDAATQINFDADIGYKTGDFLADLHEAFDERKTDLTTGVKEFDDALGGGLMRGEHTVLLASLGLGKTTTCLNFIAANILRQKYCLMTR